MSPGLQGWSFLQSEILEPWFSALVFWPSVPLARGCQKSCAGSLHWNSASTRFLSPSVHSTGAARSWKGRGTWFEIRKRGSTTLDHQIFYKSSWIKLWLWWFLLLCKERDWTNLFKHNFKKSFVVGGCAWLETFIGKNMASEKKIREA